MSSSILFVAIEARGWCIMANPTVRISRERVRSCMADRKGADLRGKLGKRRDLRDYCNRLALLAAER